MSILDHNLFISTINAYIDPQRPVDKAIITHAHTDHAKPNHNHILATRDTINIMKIRYGENCAKSFQEINYGEKIYVDGVYITFYPAGHILGSAQVLLEKNGNKTLITGDYKTIHDNTSQHFELVKTHNLVTEATFGMPIFKHPDPKKEIIKLIKSIEINSKTNHLVGAYALGKAQRVINLLRLNKYKKDIYIHGAIEKISKYYAKQKIYLGNLVKITKDNYKSLSGEIIITPPSTLSDKWSRKFNNKKTCMASGWMSIKQRAKKSLIELPLVISDHSDWNELISTIKGSQAEKVLITHGNEECLLYWCKKNNIEAEALSLIREE